MAQKNSQERIIRMTRRQKITSNIFEFIKAMNLGDFHPCDYANRVHIKLNNALWCAIGMPSRETSAGFYLEVYDTSTGKALTMNVYSDGFDYTFYPEVDSTEPPKHGEGRSIVDTPLFLVPNEVAIIDRILAALYARSADTRLCMQPRAMGDLELKLYFASSVFFFFAAFVAPFWVGFNGADICGILSAAVAPIICLFIDTSAFVQLTETLEKRDRYTKLLARVSKPRGTD